MSPPELLAAPAMTHSVVLDANVQATAHLNATGTVSRPDPIAAALTAGGAGITAPRPPSTPAQRSSTKTPVPDCVLELRTLADVHTLAAWAGRYLAAEVYGIQSHNTLLAKTRDLNGFIRFYVAQNRHGTIRHWLPRDTQAYLNSADLSGAAPATVNRILATLRRFARWCHDQPGAVFAAGGLPTQGIHELETAEAPCKKLTDQEIHNLLKAADLLVQISRDEEGHVRHATARPRRNRAILAMLYFSGLRVSELVRLTRAQYQGNHLHNVRRKGKVRTRTAYLTAECRRALDDYLATERQADDPEGLHEPLFLSTRGEGRAGRFLHRQHINRILLRIAQMEAAMREGGDKVALHPHRLRHTFGDRHRTKSGSDTETAAALGHTSVRYVGRYARKSDEEREALMEAAFAASRGRFQ